MHRTRIHNFLFMINLLDYPIGLFGFGFLVFFTC